MAVVPNATTTTSAATTIYDEYVSAISRLTLGRVATLYQHAVLRVPLMGTNSNTYDHSLRDEVGLASPLAETDEVVSTEITQSKLSVSTSTEAIATFVSKQNNRRNLWPAMGNAAQELTGSMARTIDAAFLALATSFSAPIGTNATIMTVENLVTLFTTWRARVGSTAEQPFIAMHNDAYTQLQKDAVTNASQWFGTAQGVALHDAVSDINQGQTTMFGGVEMASSPNLPAGGVSGHTNVMLARGLLEAAIAMPFEQAIELETWYEAKRQGWWVIVTADFGLGKVNDLAGQGFVTAPQ